MLSFANCGLKIGVFHKFTQARETVQKLINSSYEIIISILVLDVWRQIVAFRKTFSKVIEDGSQQLVLDISLILMIRDILHRY